MYMSRLHRISIPILLPESTKCQLLESAVVLLTALLLTSKRSLDRRFHLIRHALRCVRRFFPSIRFFVMRVPRLPEHDNILKVHSVLDRDPSPALALECGTCDMSYAMFNNMLSFEEETE